MRYTRLVLFVSLFIVARTGFAQVYVPTVSISLHNRIDAHVILDTSTENEAIIQVIGKQGKPVRGLKKLDFLVYARDSLKGEILSVDTISIPNSRRLALSFCAR